VSGSAGAERPWFTLRLAARGVEILDQRRLPGEEVYLTLASVEEVARAIEDLAVRGAPAIGCAGALGLALAARASRAGDVAGLRAELAGAARRLARTRPTAVNLDWALGRVLAAADAADPDPTPEGVAARVVDAALRLVAEDAAACRAIGAAGAALVPDGARVLTHCNAGALATAGYGTALGVVRAAVEAGRRVAVLAGETRPFLQGARLTAWELARDAIPVTVITDGMAGHLMQRGEVDLVLVGADRIAANGDVANKIGTYPLAVLAGSHGIPFYVAAPLSTIDLAAKSGDDIPIEERGRDEVARVAGRAVVPDGVPVRHPAFDVTPARLVTALVTERGVARPPYPDSLRALFR
jgi:methylthioribose-1-phosphate isomerase